MKVDICYQYTVYKIEVLLITKDESKNKKNMK